MSEALANPGSFAALVTAALDAAVTPERVATLVNEHVDKLVKSGIEDALRSWSPTGKTITKAIEASLQVNELNIPSYGHTVCAVLERQIQATVAEVVAAKLTKDMEGLLKLAPKRVKLSDLVAELLSDDSEIDSVYCNVGTAEYQSLYLTISKRTPMRNDEPDIRVLISLSKKPDDYKPGEVFEGTIALGKVSGSDLKKDIRFGHGTDFAKQGVQFGRWFGFEQKFLAMYAAGTVIELDEDNVCTSRD